jgi:hypothetical protein
MNMMAPVSDGKCLNANRSGMGGIVLVADLEMPVIQ